MNFGNELKCLIYEILDYHEQIDIDILEYINSKVSMLGIYLSYLESQGIEYKVECRPNNKFYINTCSFHNNLNEDYSLIILEDKGLFLCHRCGNGGSIINFIMEVYKIELSDAVEIINCFINQNFDKLSIENKKIYNQLFCSYDLKDEYIKISAYKTEYLNNRINNYLNYLESLNKEVNIDKVSKRLSCSKKYVKSIYNKRHL